MNTPTPHHDPSEDPQLRQMLRRLPEPAPSHGFDARLVDTIMRETPASDRPADPRAGARATSTGVTGWALGLRRPSWQLVVTASLALAIISIVVLQQLPSDNDLKQIDLITLMSLDLL
jgi:hypothetical protein